MAWRHSERASTTGGPLPKAGWWQFCCCGNGGANAICYGINFDVEIHARLCNSTIWQNTEQILARRDAANRQVADHERTIADTEMDERNTLQHNGR